MFRTTNNPYFLLLTFIRKNERITKSQVKLNSITVDPIISCDCMYVVGIISMISDLLKITDVICSKVFFIKKVYDQYSFMLISQCLLQTNKNRLIFYSIVVDESRREVYEQRDPPNPTLKRESAELYSCEPIPPLMFSTVSVTWDFTTLQKLVGNCI